MTTSETRFTVEPQPGRWDTKLGRIVTALEDAAYERGRAEATAAAEQRLRERIEELPTTKFHIGGLTGEKWRHEVDRAAVLALLDTPASPRQGEETGLCGVPDPKHPGRSCTIATGHGGSAHANDHHEWNSP